MKVLFNKLLLLLLIVCSFSSCENDDDINVPLYSGRTWVQFENRSLSTNESTVIRIPVLLSSETNEGGVTVSFSVSSDDSSRFEVEQNTITFPQGEFESEIVLTPVDDVLTNGDLTVTITLDDSETPVGIAGEGVNLNQIEVTIIDNDCPIEVGTSYTATVTAFGQNAPSHTATLVPVPGNPNQFAINSTWGPNFVAWATGDDRFNGAFIYSGTITINPADLSITVTGNDAWAAGGTGTYDSCGDTFTFTVVADGLFTNPVSASITLTAE